MLLRHVCLISALSRGLSPVLAAGAVTGIELKIGTLTAVGIITFDQPAKTPSETFILTSSLTSETQTAESTAAELTEPEAPTSNLSFITTTVLVQSVKTITLTRFGAENKTYNGRLVQPYSTPLFTAGTVLSGTSPNNFSLTSTNTSLRFSATQTPAQPLEIVSRGSMTYQLAWSFLLMIAGTCLYFVL